jgi:DNA modification methylase
MHVTNTYCMLDWTVQAAEKRASWAPEERAHLEADVATSHKLHLGDARNLNWIPDGSVHLVVTSPPYWTLKKYHDHPEQLGAVEDYESFMDELDKVWRHCYRVLVPGGRIVCVVGDVCLARRRNNGRHMVVPLHADIIVRCRRIGLDYLTPILWHKIASASYEVENGSSFLGKPYEPNAIIKNDLEYLLMLRKPGGYRKPTERQRLLSDHGRLSEVLGQPPTAWRSSGYHTPQQLCNRRQSRFDRLAPELEAREGVSPFSP